MSAAVCPNGHASTTGDYCDQCGAKIGDAPSAPADPTPVPQAGEPTVLTVACPSCTFPHLTADRFCEECGYDFTGPAPGQSATSVPLVPVGGEPPGEPAPVEPAPVEPAPGEPAPAASTDPAWEAVAIADRAYFERLDPEGVTFPPHYPERTFALSGAEISIGRRSTARGIAPGIDLSGRPEDGGISHLHALLVLQDDGSYALVDPGSTNGTTVNDDPRPVEPNLAVPLADGDRLHLGAWTTITIHSRAAP